MAVETGMYQYVNPLPDLTNKFQQGMKMGDFIKQRKKEEKISDIVQSNMIQGPNGSIDFNRAKTIKELAGVDAPTALKFQDRLQQKDEAELAQRKAREAYEMINIAQEMYPANDQASYIASRKRLADKGILMPNAPAVFDPIFKQQVLDRSIPYLERWKAEQKEKTGGMTPYQFANLKLRADANKRAERRFQYQQEEAEEQKLRDVTIEGLELGGKILPTKKDAELVRQGFTSFDDFMMNMNQLDSMVQKYGTEAFSIFDNTSGQMEQFATNAKVNLKGPAYYALGVLAGPDMGIIEAVVPDPSDAIWAITPNSKQKVREKIQTAKDIIEFKFLSQVKRRGYKLKPEQEEKMRALQNGDSMKEYRRLKSLSENNVNLPKKGTVKNGFMYMGGDPGNKKNWQKVD